MGVAVPLNPSSLIANRGKYTWLWVCGNPGGRSPEGPRPAPSARGGLSVGWQGLSTPSLPGGGRAHRKEATTSRRPRLARTLTLVDCFESAREVAVLAIAVHFTPECRHRNAPAAAAAARHLAGEAGRGGVTSAPEEDLAAGQAEKEAGRWLLGVLASACSRLQGP